MKIWLKLGNGPMSELCPGAGVGISIFFTYWRFWVGTPHPDAQTHTLCRAPAKSRGDCFLSVQPRPEWKEEKRTGPLLFFWQTQFICDLNFFLFVYLSCQKAVRFCITRGSRMQTLEKPCRTESVRRWRPRAKNVPAWQTLSLLRAPLKYVKLCEKPFTVEHLSQSLWPHLWLEAQTPCQLFSQPKAVHVLHPLTKATRQKLWDWD